MGRGSCGGLISHLSLNYLSLSEDGRGALQEILRLHNFTELNYLENQIGALSALKVAPHFAMVVSDYGLSPARGSAVEIELDEQQFNGGERVSVCCRGGPVYRWVRVDQQLYAVDCDDQPEKGAAEHMATAIGEPGTAVAIAEMEMPLDSSLLSGADPFAQIRKLLEQETFMVEFFQAVRLLQRMEKGRNAVGYFSAPGMEAVRFSALPSLVYPPSQLFELERMEDGQLRLVVQFFGLCAAVTIMPHAYTEYLMLLEKNKDEAMTEFFDMFNTG